MTLADMDLSDLKAQLASVQAAVDAKEAAADGAGALAAAELFCGIVLGTRYGVPFDHSFPLGAVLYSVVFLFWKMSSHNALKYDHAQMTFRLMQEENFAKGNRR